MNIFMLVLSTYLSVLSLIFTKESNLKFNIIYGISQMIISWLIINFVLGVRVRVETCLNTDRLDLSGSRSSTVVIVLIRSSSALIIDKLSTEVAVHIF